MRCVNAVGTSRAMTTWETIPLSKGRPNLPAACCNTERLKLYRFQHRQSWMGGAGMPLDGPKTRLGEPTPTGQPYEGMAMTWPQSPRRILRGLRLCGVPDRLLPPCDLPRGGPDDDAGALAAAGAGVLRVPGRQADNLGTPEDL